VAPFITVFITGALLWLLVPAHIFGMAVTIHTVHLTGATTTGTIVTINKQTALLNQQGCFVYRHFNSKLTFLRCNYHSFFKLQVQAIKCTT
jgi:hypothetical protein